MRYFEICEAVQHWPKTYTYATKTGEPLHVYTLRQRPDEDRFPDYDGAVLAVVAKIGDEMVGHGEFYYDAHSGFGSFEDVRVMPQYRRRGIATVLYDHLAKLGFKIEPTSGRMERDGLEFWKQRDPAKVRNRR